MKKNDSRGHFITLEGIDGAGKSAILPLIERCLLDRRIDFIITREPGGTEIAERIRAIVLSHNNEFMCDDAELLLYFAARAQHLDRLIKPALESGSMVISDRFTDSTYAYQGAARGMDIHKISVLENLVQGELRPDLVLILDIRPEEGLRRLVKARMKDRFETEKIDFFQRARNWYLERAKQNSERYKVIDAARSIDLVAKETNEIILTYIKK